MISYRTSGEHEVIPAAVLKPEHSELTLAVSGDGRGTFPDIVMRSTSNTLTVTRRLPEPEIAQTWGLALQGGWLSGVAWDS